MWLTPYPRLLVVDGAPVVEDGDHKREHVPHRMECKTTDTTQGVAAVAVRTNNAGWKWLHSNMDIMVVALKTNGGASAPLMRLVENTPGGVG